VGSLRAKMGIESIVVRCLVSMRSEYPGRFRCVLQELARSHELRLSLEYLGTEISLASRVQARRHCHVFKTTVFSSDFRSIKPSPALFREALAAFQANASKVLCVGDSLQRDIEPARKLGLATAWINPQVSPSSASKAGADYVFHHCWYLTRKRLTQTRLCEKSAFLIVLPAAWEKGID